MGGGWSVLKYFLFVWNWNFYRNFRLQMTKYMLNKSPMQRWPSKKKCQPFRYWYIVNCLLTLKVLKYFYINQETKGFFQFELKINVLVGSFRFIWIPMLWVYGHYKYFTLSVWDRLQMSESDVVRFWRLKSAPQKGLDKRGYIDKAVTFLVIVWCFSLCQCFL